MIILMLNNMDFIYNILRDLDKDSLISVNVSWNMAEISFRIHHILTKCIALYSYPTTSILQAISLLPTLSLMVI